MSRWSSASLLLRPMLETEPLGTKIGTRQHDVTLDSDADGSRLRYYGDCIDQPINRKVDRLTAVTKRKSALVPAGIGFPPADQSLYAHARAILGSHALVRAC